MTLKEKIVFGLYVATAVAIVAESTIVITKGVMQDRREKKNLKAVEEAEQKN